MDKLTIGERRELVSAKVTLDGKPAVICGVMMDFATVAQIPSGSKFEWSWDAVKRIVASGGAFKS